MLNMYKCYLHTSNTCLVLSVSAYYCSFKIINKCMNNYTAQLTSMRHHMKWKLYSIR